MVQQYTIQIGYLRLSEIINLTLNTRIRGCVLNVVLITSTGKTSYIEAVKWGDFIISPDYYIDLAIKRQENIFDYNVRKEV